MLSLIQRCHALLSSGERRQVLALALLGVLAALMQVGGIASIMPFMAVLANPGVIETNRHLAWAYETLGFSSPNRFLFALGCLVFAVMLAGIAVNALATWLQARFANYTGHNLSRRLLVHYLRRPYAYFLERNSSELTKNIFTEVTQVVNGFIRPGILLVAHGLTALAVFLLLLVVDPGLAATVGVILGGAYGLIFFLVRKRLTRVGRERVQTNRARFQAAGEAFGGIKEIKLMGREEIYTGRFSAPSKQFASCTVQQQVISQMPRHAMEALAFGGILVIVLYLLTIKQDISQALPLMALYALAGYRLMPVLQQIFQSVAEMRYSAPVLNTLHRELTETGENRGEPPGRAEGTGRLVVKESLELDNVTFAYAPASRPVLDNFSLRIPAASMVGLVGITGSGKTTTVDLILGLLRPRKGELRVDGVPVADANLRRWQNSLGYVSQHIYLADDTVRRNIAFGVPDRETDQSRVERSARAACIHEFVVGELPKGYDTAVGERGVRLSGGQRQRIGIARALYHDPEVLILDEATSALDNLTEQRVMEAIHELGRTKTVIIIAHRLTTVKQCDRIYVLERGRVVCEGDFDTLLATSGEFRRMATTEQQAEP